MQCQVVRDTPGEVVQVVVHGVTAGNRLVAVGPLSNDVTK